MVQKELDNMIGREWDMYIATGGNKFDIDDQSMDATWARIQATRQLSRALKKDPLLLTLP